MTIIEPERKQEPEVTAIEGSRRSWLILLVYAALTVILGRIAWNQIVERMGIDGGFRLQTSYIQVFILLAVCLFMIVRILLSLRNFVNALRLDQYGEVCSAMIIDKWRKNSSEDEDYWIAFEYGDGWKAKVRVNYQGFQKVNVGDDTLVEYLPSNPRVTRIKQN